MSKDLPTVLVIDDEEDLRELIAEALKTFDLAVVTASNGTEGLHKANNQTFDLIVCDLNMPKMNGTQAVALIKKTKMNSNTPIVVFSGNIDQMAIQQLKGQILKAFVKPCDLNEVASFIATQIFSS